MVEKEAHLTVEISYANLLVLNLWCKAEGLKQKEAIAKLITDYAPRYKLEVA